MVDRVGMQGEDSEQHPGPMSPGHPVPSLLQQVRFSEITARAT